MSAGDRGRRSRLAEKSDGNGWSDRCELGAAGNRVGGVEIVAFAFADLLVAAEHLARALEADERSPRRAAEGGGGHAAAVLQYEARIETKGRRDVPHLHPAVRLPPQILDLVCFEVRASRHRRRAVVLSHPRVADA